MEGREKHFVLVHGACHGAWCWYKVATLLKKAGHRVTTLDMAASGIHPSQVQELHSSLDYFKPLMEFMASLPSEERVILVGHSMGGYGISAAMERFPERVSVAVFCTAFMPGPDLDDKILSEEVFPYNDYQKVILQNVIEVFASTETIRQVRRSEGSTMDSVFTFDNGPSNPATSLLFGPQFLSSKLYQLSPPEDLTLALLLVRPIPLYNDGSVITSIELTKDNYGSVHRVYIVCDKDNVLHEDLQRWLIEKNPPDDVKLISGSDHMAMFSKPKELHICLEEIAGKCP